MRVYPAERALHACTLQKGHSMRVPCEPWMKTVPNNWLLYLSQIWPGKVHHRLVQGFCMGCMCVYFITHTPYMCTHSIWQETFSQPASPSRQDAPRVQLKWLPSLWVSFLHCTLLPSGPLLPRIFNWQPKEKNAGSYCVLWALHPYWLHLQHGLLLALKQVKNSRQEFGLMMHAPWRWTCHLQA